MLYLSIKRPKNVPNQILHICFLVLLTINFYPQDKIEDDVDLDQNRIEFYIGEADKETQQSNYYNAINTLEKAFEIAEKIGNEKDQGIIYSRIANLEYNLEKYKEASITIIKAMAIQSKIDDKVNLAVSRYTCGIIYLAQEDYTNALDYFKSAKTIFEEESINELVAKVTLFEAKAHMAQNNLSEANSLIDQAIILSKKYDLPIIQSSALIKSGDLAFKEGKYDRALAQTIEGSNLAKIAGNLDVLNESYKALSIIYENSGNYQLANANLNLFIKLSDSISNIKKENLIAEKEFIDADKDTLIQTQKDQIEKKNESDSLNRLTTILSVGLITILSLLTLSLYKNNNIRLKTNNMLYRKMKSY